MNARASGEERELIAIQGELGSFSHEAALLIAREEGASVQLVPCPRSPEVFERLAEGSVQGAVIPIENSLAGSVLEHHDLLRTHPVRIVRERLLRVRHNLIAAPGSRIEELREVYSHPIALDQCREFFRRHPWLRASSFYDTAGSVRHVVGLGADGASRAGAIGSREAAAQYGGELLAEGIEDNPENYTRFFLLRRGHAVLEEVAGPAKVSLCFAVENRPGSLVEALRAFADRATNLTRLESRPVPGAPWQYIFYADFEIGGELAGARSALEELRRHCSMVKELGCYPAAAGPKSAGPTGH